jgi:hypothetical protein
MMAVGLLALALFAPRAEAAYRLWTPADTNTTLWLDAADTNKVTLNGSAVSQWSDKSGNNRHATQSTGSLQPAYTTAGLNGLNVVTFDGSDDYLEASATYLQGKSLHSVSYVFVRKGNSSGDGYGPGVTTTTGSTVDRGSLHYVKNSNLYGASYPYYSNYGSYDLSSGTAYANDTGYLIQFRSQTTTWLVRRTGTQEGATGNITAAPASDITRLILGKQLNPVRSSKIQIGEIVILLDSIATQANNEKVEGYLAHKWGLTNSLPSDHPYKTQPPLVEVPDSPIPTIANLAAANVTTISADLRGMLTSTGSSACAVCVYWGTDTNAWANTNWFNGGAVNDTWTNNTLFSTNIALSPMTTYYYTFGASNATANVVAESPVSVMAIHLPAVTNLGAVPGLGSALLQGQVTDTGGDTPYTWFYYWPAGGSTSIVAVGQQSGTFSTNVVITAIGVHSYQVLASNMAGLTWSTISNFTVAALWTATNGGNHAGADWTLVNGDVIAGVHTNVGQFIVPAGATVTVRPYTNGPAFGRALIYAQSASIEGSLRADGGGYGHGAGPGAASNGEGGGGYGGRGGGGDGKEYGDAYNPTNMGSGGQGGVGGTAGAGGGAIALMITGTATVNGTLSANGGNDTYRAAGGSGGSILIKAGAIQGTGTVSADGGSPISGSSFAGGGAGGRIAFDTPANSFAGIIRAAGRSGKYSRAHNGTFSFVSGEGIDLVISNDIALPPGTNWTFRSLLVTNNARFEIQSTGVVSRVRFLGDVTIAGGSTLAADCWGHLANEGTGKGSGRSGAGYGGLGGQGSDGTRGAIYGDANNPTNLGSGGANGGGGVGGFGAGALILEIDGMATVNGTVSANGGQGVYRASGGSGGSIRIMAASLKGTGGTISADGGLSADASYAAGGAGGRVLIFTGAFADAAKRPAAIQDLAAPPATFTGTITVTGQAGQSGYLNAENGTKVFRYLPRPGGTVFTFQ